MCGIVAYVGQQEALPIILKGLRRLEYRGYDSAGVAVVNDSGELQRLRRLGKVKELADAVAAAPETRPAKRGDSEISAEDLTETIELDEDQDAQNRREPAPFRSLRRAQQVRVAQHEFGEREEVLGIFDGEFGDGDARPSYYQAGDGFMGGQRAQNSH